MNYKTNYGVEEAGMAQLDDSVGALLKHLDDIGEADNTIVVFTTDNGAEVFTWPDGGMTPFKATKGTVMEGGFRAPAIARWPGKIKAGTVENGVFSGLDWFPTLLAAAGNPNITDELLKGVKLGDRTYKNHLDGYNQLDLLARQGAVQARGILLLRRPSPGRRPDRRFQVPVLPAAARLAGAEGHDRHAHHREHPPGSVRADPVHRRSESERPRRWLHERLLCPRVLALRDGAGVRWGSWRRRPSSYPPMQDPASFNLEAIKKKVEEAIRSHSGQ